MVSKNPTKRIEIYFYADRRIGETGADVPTSCCFSYTSRKLPRGHVQDYFITSSMCSQPAIIFITKKGREVCANPIEEWVEKHVDYLEQN
uniref:C-C motif chemokine n=1 Tax=Geotrypetes seraphini TaxID=260995 RepID=A0A6P8PPV4_GEOSA|nr:C-C motif chemokine 4-like isoform X2 [Geotrypetes seraphini]